MIGFNFLSKNGKVGQIPKLLLLIFFLVFPNLVEYFSKLQEDADFVRSALKTEYLLNKEETFDYIISKLMKAGAKMFNLNICVVNYKS